MCAKSINERGRQIQVLNSHNSKRIEDVIGIPLEVKEVERDGLPDEVKAEWPEATGGLFTQTKYLLDTPEGLGAFIRIKAGQSSSTASASRSFEPRSKIQSGAVRK